MTDAITKLREPAALGAAVFAALSTLAAVIYLLFSSGGSFTDIAYGETGNLLSFPVALAVAIAVFLANHAGPAVAKARLITLVSLVTVAVAAVFGLVSFFAGFGAESVSGTGKFSYFLAGAGGGVVIALAAWYTWLTWQAHAPARPAAPVGPASPGGWAPGPQQQPQPQQPQQGPALGAHVPPPGFGWQPGNAAEQTAYLPPQNPAGPPQTLQAQQSASGSFSVPQQQGAQHGQPQQPQHGQQPPMHGHQQPQHGQPPQQPQHGQPQRPFPGGGEATQMMPPVPPTMQEYAPSPQPWQPQGPGGNAPQQQPHQPQQGQQGQPMRPGERPAEPEQGNGPFGVGNWQ